MSQALAAAPILVHDQGQVVAVLACAIADGARVISDFRVMADQRELSGLVASAPASGGRAARIRSRARCWRLADSRLSTSSKEEWPPRRRLVRQPGRVSGCWNRSHLPACLAQVGKKPPGVTRGLAGDSAPVLTQGGLSMTVYMYQASSSAANRSTARARAARPHRSRSGRHWRTSEHEVWWLAFRLTNDVLVV